MKTMANAFITILAVSPAAAGIVAICLAAMVVILLILLRRKRDRVPKENHPDDITEVVDNEAETAVKKPEAEVVGKQEAEEKHTAAEAKPAEEAKPTKEAITTGETNPEGEAKEIKETEENLAEYREMFERMSKMMQEEKTYLDSRLSRDDLIQKLGTTKNKFGKMMTSCSGEGNLPSYLNSLRFNYAVELMKAHPDWSIDAIALDSGFSGTRNLQRIFKEKTGLTPAEYRKESNRKK
jgi:AraC-like DNA-binding protein